MARDVARATIKNKLSVALIRSSSQTLTQLNPAESLEYPCIIALREPEFSRSAFLSSTSQQPIAQTPEACLPRLGGRRLVRRMAQVLR